MRAAALRADIPALTHFPGARAVRVASVPARRPDRRGGQPSRPGRVSLAVAIIAAHAAGVAGLAYMGASMLTLPAPVMVSPRPMEVAFVAPRAEPRPPVVTPQKVETPPPVPPPVQPRKIRHAPAKTVQPVKAPEQAISEEKTEPVAEAAPPVEAAPPAVSAPPAAPAPSVADAAPAVTEARFDADYLHNPAPVYPLISRRMREEGRVMLRVLVSAAGEPLRVELARGSDSTRLDEAAREAVSRWRFVPARKGDQAVDAWVQVPIIFNLEGK